MGKHLKNRGDDGAWTPAENLPEIPRLIGTLYWRLRYSLAEIAEETSLSLSKVQRLMVQYDIPRRRYGPVEPVGRRGDPPEIVARVKALYYEQGLTGPQIAAILERSRHYVWKLMRRNGMTPRTNGQIAAAPHRFQGTKAEYTTHHKRVKEQRGMPQRCEGCGTDDSSKRYEWANLTGRYEDPMDYRRLCKQCHHRYDNPRRGAPRDEASLRTPY